MTHCFAGQDFEESEIQETSELFEIPVLRQDWVIQSARCKTLLPVSAFSVVSTKQIFSGLNISSSRLSKRDTESLWALIVSRGGRFDCELGADSTHLIVGGREVAGSKKYEAALSRQNRISIVTPGNLCFCIVVSNYLSGDLD